jgi:drug/metabolite transporter (DMT)-like permease
VQTRQPTTDTVRPAAPPATRHAGALALTWADGAALLAVFSWGANFPVMKQLMTAIEPLPMMCVRTALAGLLLVGLVAYSGQWRWPERRDLRPLLAVSVVGVTLNLAFIAYGLHLTTASHSGLIFTLTPLFVFGMSYALRQVRLHGLDLVGLVLGVLGAALIVGAPTVAGGDSGGATLLGDALTVGAVITWGVWTLLAAPLVERYGALLATAWSTALGAIGLVPLSLPALLAQDWTLVSGTVVAGLVYTAVFVGVVSSLLWYGAIGRLGAARTAIYANMESFFAVLAAAILLGERVEGTALLGGIAVVAGVLLTRRAERG